MSAGVAPASGGGSTTGGGSTGPGAPGGADLDALLAQRLRPDLSGTVLQGRRASVVFDTGTGDLWTVTLDGGTAVRRGGLAAPTLSVRGSSATLASIVDASAPGVAAFLESRLIVRGDLSLALALDALFLGADDRPAAHPRSRMLPVMGVRTSFLVAGPAEAPPVVLLHGLGASNASMLPVLADLARDHRVLAPDLPGFGASDAPAAAYNSAWFAAWLEEFQAATGSRGAALVGNSLGGRVALEAGLAHPRSVRALVLLNPSPAFRRLRQWVPLVRLLDPRLARLPALPVPHRVVTEAMRAMMSDPDRLPGHWYDAAADEAVRVLRSPAHRAAFLAAIRHIYLDEAHGRWGFWDRLPGLTPPALFLWGDRDRLVPASFARHVSDALPAAAALVLEDCGHVPQFEHPAETMAVLRGFLETVPPVAR